MRRRTSASLDFESRNWRTMRRSSSCSSEKAKFMDPSPAPGTPGSPLPSCTHVYMNIRELRANLAAAVRQAEAGHRVVVTVGGRPVAQLGPLDPGSEEPTLDDLAARGLLLAARRADRPAPDLIVAMPVGTRLDRLLDEVR